MNLFKRIAQALLAHIRDPLQAEIAAAILQDLEPHLVAKLSEHFAAEAAQV